MLFFAEMQSYAATQIGMGMGGPLGGFISDRYARYRPRRKQSEFRVGHRYGWRAAFKFQLPLFLLSFTLTGYNLRYVTPVRRAAGPGTSKAHSQYRERVRHQEKSSKGLTTVVSSRPLRGYVNLSAFCSTIIITIPGFFCLTIFELSLQRTTPGM